MKNKWQIEKNLESTEENLKIALDFPENRQVIGYFTGFRDALRWTLERKFKEVVK